MSDFFATLPRNENAELPVAAESGADDSRDPLEQLCRAELLSIDGVEGWAPRGEDQLVVYVRDSTVVDRLPARIAGRIVEAAVQGEIRAW